MGTIEFIRKDLFFLAAIGAFAGERLQASQIFQSGAVLRGGHVACHLGLLIPL
jgi:hypothetical protein